MKEKKRSLTEALKLLDEFVTQEKMRLNKETEIRAERSEKKLKEAQNKLKKFLKEVDKSNINSFL